MHAGWRRRPPNRVDVPGPSDSSARFVGVRPETQGAARIPPVARYSEPMSAQRPQFDSHRFVKRLTMAGLAEEVAEILADEHTKLIVPEDVATKDDVGAVSADLGAVKAEMATKADLRTVSADLAAVSAKVDRVSNDLDGVKAVMATKEDLRREIAASEARMEQRMQSAILEAKVSLIKWMIATNLATMAVFSGIVIGTMSALQ